MTLSQSAFGAFHRAVYEGREPFPWQDMLARRVVEQGWPECLDLPTASGKTACIDVAVFALACQAEVSTEERTAPRRIFFVVDRRIVVDAAYQRALRLAKALSAATQGVLLEIADRLRSLQGGGIPLGVARIRGGVARDDGWVRSPAQATVVTGTVDQVGSRLLFRGYGPGELTASIHAALAANDSLILLDEAHCAVPFFQTAKAVERYRGTEWADEPIATPFRVVVMSATPPAEAAQVFPTPAERQAALDHPLLHQRMKSAKPAELAIATKPKMAKGKATALSEETLADELVLDAADRAMRLASNGWQRIAIMVNRVQTARRIHERILSDRATADKPLDADLVLMTGRMRPLDRDDLIERWAGQLEARPDQPALDRPIILVTTQCLEVGADFSFDALITECASLDALRQRFGRLDRLGTAATPHGVVLIRRHQIKTEEQLVKLEKAGETADPVYGNALARTWNWLNLHAHRVEEGKDGRLLIDLGIQALEQWLPLHPDERRRMLAPLIAPSPDAPVMLPAHVDCWVQTAPRPRPDPDVALFLHGPGRGVPDVHVVLRADLALEDPDETWVEAVSLCPPSSLEAFSVPIHVVRAWAAGASPKVESVADVEGPEQMAEEPASGQSRRLLIWAGRDRSRVVSAPSQVQPKDVVVVSASDVALEAFGDVPAGTDGSRVLDFGDRAFLQARARPMLRVNATVMTPWKRHPAVKRLIEWAKADDREDDRHELGPFLDALVQSPASVVLDDGTQVEGPPAWMRQAAAALLASGEAARFRGEILLHPSGGYALSSRRRLSRPPGIEARTAEEDASADEDDLTCEAAGPVLLPDHLDATAAVARQFGRSCLPGAFVEAVVRAAQLHDIGKVDWRFQVMLHSGNELEAFRSGVQLAKSDRVPRSVSARERARRLAKLPDRFRHEMLSVQMAESTPALLRDVDADLVLYLLGSHHGYGRPFAPVVIDDEPPDAQASVAGTVASLTGEQRQRLVPPHRIDSGVGGRFWRLTRRYGWWALAYLEAIVRLADWEASDRHEEVLAGVKAAGTDVA